MSTDGSSTVLEPVTMEPDRANRPLPRLRVVRLGSDGTLALDLPATQIAESIADPGAVVWVDVDDRNSDLSGVESLLLNTFHFHPLAVEDALLESNTPKVDDWGGYLYLVFHTILFDSDTLELFPQEIDVFLGRNYLVTYHAEPQGCIDALRRLIERDATRMARGPDHLLYHLLDAGVADFLPAIERLDEAIDEAQDEVFGDPTPATLRRIFRIKRAALRLHRSIIPLREVLNRLARDEYAQIDAPDRVYFRDVYDHLVRLHDISETLRDLISGALDTYLSAVANRTNEVMKTLTIVSLFFLPLNFVVGFFGMNFFGDNIVLHDLKLPHNFIFGVILFLMALSPVGLRWWVKRRGWF